MHACKKYMHMRKLHMKVHLPREPGALICDTLKHHGKVLLLAFDAFLVCTA